MGKKAVYFTTKHAAARRPIVGKTLSGLQARLSHKQTLCGCFSVATDLVLSCCFGSSDQLPQITQAQLLYCLHKLLLLFHGILQVLPIDLRNGQTRPSQEPGGNKHTVAQELSDATPPTR